MSKPSDIPETLQLAFEQLDATSERLDSLKRTLNDTSRELSTVAPELVRRFPSPIPVPPVPSAPHKRPAGKGIYSIPTPLSSERPMEFPKVAKPLVPRPAPRQTGKLPPPLPPVRKLSGRFYLQISCGRDGEVLGGVRDQLCQVGRVVDSGFGTASNPRSGWVEVAARSDMPALIAQLRKIGIVEIVEKVIEVKPGEGRVQARQLDLPRTGSGSNE